MTAKWTVLALLAAAPAFSQNTIQLTYDSFDSADSTLNPGLICSPTKPATATNSASGFSFPINWSCWSGNATVTGSVTMSFSPATVTATKTGTWGTLNFSTAITMTATAVISGTGVTGASLTASTAFPSSKGLLEANPIAGCNQSSITGPGTVTLTCPVTTVQGWNDTVGLMPAFGIALNVVTADRDGTAWGDGVQVYGKFKQCSGNSCPSDKIAIAQASPANDQPIMLGNQVKTPHFYVKALYDLESVQNGQVSLQLIGGTGNGPVTLVDRAGTQNVTQGVAAVGLDGELTIGPVPLPQDAAITGFTLRAILSDASGHELASDLLHYQTLSVTMSLQLGCASGEGDQWGLADPSTFVADSSPPKVFYRLKGYPQTCPLSPSPGLQLAIRVTYTSPVHGIVSDYRTRIPAPDGDKRQYVIYANMDGAEINLTESAIRSLHAPTSHAYRVMFLTDSGQIAANEYAQIPLEFVVPWPPTSTPVPGSPNISVSVPLDYNIIEPGLKLYRKPEVYPAPTEIPQSHSDTFVLAPNGKASTRVTYSLGPTPDPAVVSGSTDIHMAPATLAIPPVTGSTSTTVSTPAVSLSVQHNTANRSVATTELSQSIDYVKASANVNTGNLPSPQFSMSAAPAADASINGYIPIDSTYSFTPAIPQDGSFAAGITFQYAASDLPDDPNFVEASLQVISYDPATGVVTSYPTVLDTLNKKATAQITGLAPYYSLAVLGPFTKTTVSLPYLAPAAGMSPLTALVNWGGTDASLEVGSPASATPNTTALKAGAQLARSPAQWFGGTDPSLQNSSAWLRVKSDQSAVAAAQLFSGMGLEFAAPLGTPAGTLVFPNVQSDDLFETNFTLVNPSTATITVSLYLRGKDGTNVDSAAIDMAGLGSWSGSASNTFAKLTQPFQGYVLVVSPQNLIGYEMLAGPKVVAALPALPLPAAVSGTATLYAPNFTYGGGTGSTMHLSNPTGKDANVTIRLYDASGNALGQPLTKLVPAGQQAAIDVGAILGAPPTTAVSGSVAVQCTIPAVMGDLSTGDAWGFLTDRAALPLVSTLSPNLVLPYLANDGATYTASVAVFNPNSGTAAVKISAFGTNGASAGSASFNVPANGRIAGALSTLVPAAKGLSAGYLRIDANVPVIAAGFMNSPAGGDSAAMLALPTTGPAGSGGGTNAPKFAASTSSLDFGSVAVTQVSDKAVTLQNTGTAALNITSFTPPASPFTLTAPATPFSIAAGASQNITVRFAPTVAGSQSGSVKIATNDPAASLFTLALTGQATAAGSGVKPAFPANGVVNAASYTTTVARCSIASIFGTNLANTATAAGSLPLPTILGGVQVMVGGVPAPLYVVTPLQINFQVPCELPLTGSATITVNNNGAASAPQSVTLAPYAPGVFYRSSASVDADIIHVDNSWVSQSNPAKPGEILIVWATGIGNLSQLATTGAGWPGSPPAQAVDLPTVTVGGAAAAVQFAGLTPGSVGLVQINIQLPSTLPAGTSLPLVVTFPGGAASQPVNLWVQSSATGPVRGTVLVSDSFNRADAPACSLGRADLASGGSGSHYYLPVFPAVAGTYPVGLVSKALQNLGLDYAGVQLTASSTCGGARGETFAQDLDIAVDLLVPASSAGVVQAGPYFRARAAGAGDGIVGAAGYWVVLTSTGEVDIRGLSPNAVIATTGSPASFDATKFHTLEAVAQASSLTVYLDNARLKFTQNSASVTTVALPATTGSNDGTVGIAFGDEANRGKAGGQRAQNLIIAQPGGTR